MNGYPVPRIEAQFLLLRMSIDRKGRVCETREKAILELQAVAAGSGRKRYRAEIDDSTISYDIGVRQRTQMSVCHGAAMVLSSLLG